MKLKINETFPNVDLYMFDSGPKIVSASDLFANKNCLLVAVPGAFTPTCSENHLPGYIKSKDKIFKKNIDKIFFVSVNDPFVMNEWGKKYNETDIVFLSDPFAELAKIIDFKMDLTQIGLGVRLSRFAMLIRNNIVEKIFDDNGGELEKSKADEVLKIL